MNLLRDVLASLDALFRRSRIEYAVIGSYAVAAWGQVRATRDIDLLCSTKDLNALKAALEGGALRYEHRTGDVDDPICDVVRIEVGTGPDPYEVDVLFGIRGAPAGILERLRRVQLEDLEVPVASPEDTIVLKLLGGSAQDIEDARSILRVQKGRLNLSLTWQLCPESLKHLLKEIIDAEAITF